MSECVVRMEMPLNCLECPMYDWNRQKLCCNAHFDLRPIPNGGVPKPDWCPILCQLPEGHGRLVDADDLERYWLSRIALMDSCAGKGGILESVERSTLRSCIEDIGNSKTIVPAEAERSET